MLSYRTFCNTDPPVLTEIWRRCVGQGGLSEPVSPDLFEQFVFAKLYFDYGGLFITRQDGQPVGFAHAGFGPDEEGNRLSTELGVVCLVLVRPDCSQVAEVAAGLLQRCEGYLRDRGAKVIYGGGIRPLDCFYLGLYGGSELPGVLDCDLVARQLYAAHGYREIDRTLAVRRRLSGFQAVIDRRQMQIRRQMIVEVTVDPKPRTWWEATTWGEFDLTRFELVPRGGGTPVAWAIFRSMSPAAIHGTGRATGLIELGVDESLRRRGLAIFLLSEAFRQFVGQGIVSVEAQVMQQNLAAQGLYQKLGFRPVGFGSVFRKE